MTHKLLFLFLSGLPLFAQDGGAVYKKHCASCHDAPVGRVPPVSALRAMNYMAIVGALESGSMKIQGEALSSAERYSVAGFLAPPAAVKAPTPAAATCPAGRFDMKKGASWSSWGGTAANTRSQDVKAAGLSAGDVPRLKLKWAYGLGDGIATRSQPGVAGGRVFVGTQEGTVHALDARTACTHWTFVGDTAIRTAIVVGDPNAVYFGDQKGNAYSVDATNGKLRWKVHVDEHFAALITGAPQLYKGVVYVPVASFEEVMGAAPNYQCCTFRGSVVALDAATGKRLWQTYTISEPSVATKKGRSGPSGAAVWTTPTIDDKRDVLYISTGDNYSEPATKTSDAVLALDRKTGKILWSRQFTANDTYNSGCDIPGKAACPEGDGPDADFGQPPILVSLGNGRRALVIGQKSGMVHAIDPDKEGAILWETRVGEGGKLGGIQWGSAADGQNMYVALSDVRIGGIEPDSKAAQGYRLLLDPNKGGSLVALRLTTGEKVWTAKPAACGEKKMCSPAQSAAVSVVDGVVFSGALDGHLRGYSTANGEIVWDVDTAREYETVNGQKARGGSLDGPGPVIVGGMLYVNSGYGQWGGMPGNVLLGFSVDGK